MTQKLDAAIVSVRYFLADIENENYDPDVGDPEVTAAEFDEAEGVITYVIDGSYYNGIGKLRLTKNLA